MRFRIARDDFSQILSQLQGFLSQQALREEIKNGLLLEATGHQLRLSATDLEIFFRGQIPAEVEEPGALIVDGKHLRGIIRELPEQQVLFEEERADAEGSQQLRISSGRSRMKLIARAGELYPALPAELEEDGQSDADPVLLGQLFERTLFSSSSDDSRPNLNGVFLSSGETPETLCAASTDGHRLSVVARSLFSVGAAGALGAEGVIIPRKAVVELKKLLDGGAALSVAQRGNYLSLATADFQIAIRLVDAKFPDYRRVIPSENPHSYRLSRGALVSALKRLCLVHHEVVLSFSPEQLTLNCEAEQSQGEEQLSLVSGSDEELQIKFNAKFIQDILSITKGDEVEFLLKNSVLPGIVRDCTPETERDVFVIMPMNL